MESITKERIKIAREISDAIIDKFQYYINRIWLFGSVARGQDRKESDIDLEVLLDADMLPVDSGGFPIGFQDFIYSIEKSARDRGYKVNIDSRRLSEFLKELKGKAGYEKDFAKNLVRDRIELYNQRKALSL